MNTSEDGRTACVHRDGTDMMTEFLTQTAVSSLHESLALSFVGYEVISKWSCWGAHRARRYLWPLRAEGSLQPTASKKSNLSVLQLQGTEFCPQPEGLLSFPHRPSEETTTSAKTLVRPESGEVLVPWPVPACTRCPIVTNVYRH